MGYRELINLRGPVSATWLNEATKRRTWEARMKTFMHQANGERVHIAPTYVNNAALDGWTFDQGDLLFGVGARNGLGDGWCGVQYNGARLWLKLARLLWYHAPSGGIQFITPDAPTYNRSLIKAQAQNIVVGPDGGQAEIAVAQSYTWHGQWTTPGGGELYTRWYNESRKLKLAPVINVAGRKWITANAMPTNGAWKPADTYLAFAYEIDASEVPSWALSGVAKALTEMDDHGGQIQVRDAAGQVAFYLPLGQMWSTGDTEGAVQMCQKVVLYGGKHYLLVGAPLAQIAELPAGDLVFDPMLTLQPDAAGEDTSIYATQNSRNYGTLGSLYIGERTIDDGGIFRTLIRFDLTMFPDNAAITSAIVSLWALADYSNNARMYRVYRQKRAWLEGNKYGGEDEPASGATWIRYDITNNWSAEGGFHADDCEQEDIGNRAFTAAEALNEFKPFALTPTTKAALDLGNGWMIKADTEDNDAYSFASSDYATVGYHPKLVVEYALAARRSTDWATYGTAR